MNDQRSRAAIAKQQGLMKQQGSENSKTQLPWVVGIGASAGGLEALTQFISNLHFSLFIFNSLCM